MFGCQALLTESGENFLERFRGNRLENEVLNSAAHGIQQQLLGRRIDRRNKLPIEPLGELTDVCAERKLRLGIATEVQQHYIRNTRRRHQSCRSEWSTTLRR